MGIMCVTYGKIAFLQYEFFRSQSMWSFQFSIYLSYLPQCSRFSLQRLFNSLIRFIHRKYFFLEVKMNGVMRLFPQFLSQNVGYCHPNSKLPSSPIHFTLFPLIQHPVSIQQLSLSCPGLSHSLAIVTSNMTDICMQEYLQKLGCILLGAHSKLYNWIK